MHREPRAVMRLEHLRREVHRRVIVEIRRKIADPDAAIPGPRSRLDWPAAGSIRNSPQRTARIGCDGEAGKSSNGSMVKGGTHPAIDAQRRDRLRITRDPVPVASPGQLEQPLRARQVEGRIDAQRAVEGRDCLLARGPSEPAPRRFRYQASAWSGASSTVRWKHASESSNCPSVRSIAPSSK